MPPYRYLLRGVAVGVAATAVVAGVFGHIGVASGHVVARATGQVDGAGRKPIRVKARPRPAALTAGQPNDPLWSNSWSLTKVRTPGAWRLTTGAPETIVAVLDTGIDRDQADLQGSLVDGWDAVNEDADPADDHGHGTLVAGVIAARSNNGIGGVGVCPRCSLMPVKVIGANGAGSAADIAEGIVWAADHGARVINMSFALSGSDDGIAQSIAYAQARGVLVVAAAGNAGTSDVTFPAAYPGVVSVAATDASDARYDWSSYGGWVRLAAPGCSVATAAGGSYADFCGTSSATAFVSGLAGLARSFVPDRASAEINEKLASSAAAVGGFVLAGRVDADALLHALQPGRPQPASPPASADPGLARE